MIPTMLRRHTAESAILKHCQAVYEFEDGAGSTFINQRGPYALTRPGTDTHPAGRVNRCARLFNESVAPSVSAHDFHAGSRPVTVCAWLNPDALDVSRHALACLWPGDGSLSEYHLTFDKIQNNWTFTTYYGTTTYIARQTTGAPAVGAWDFVAGGFDGSLAWVSRNAAVRNTTGTPGITNLYSSAVFTVGHWWNGQANGFLGMIDQVCVWTRTVSDAELAWMYNNGAGRSYRDMVAAPY